MAAVKPKPPPDPVVPPRTARRPWRLPEGNFRMDLGAAAGAPMTFQAPLNPREAEALVSAASDLLAAAAAEAASAALASLPARAELAAAEASLAKLKQELDALAGQDEALARQRAEAMRGPVRDLGAALLKQEAATAAVARQRDEAQAAVRALSADAGRLRTLLLGKAREALLAHLQLQLHSARQRRLEGLIGLTAAAAPWLERLFDGEVVLRALADADGLRAAAERDLLASGILAHPPASGLPGGVEYTALTPGG